jgi:hypothetical protein
LEVLDPIERTGLITSNASRFQIRSDEIRAERIRSDEIRAERIRSEQSGVENPRVGAEQRDFFLLYKKKEEKI